MIVTVFMSWVADLQPYIETIGIAGGLLFTGAGFRRDASARYASTLLDITAQHRELWMYFCNHPELAGLLDPKRELREHPLGEHERRFTAWVFNHIYAAHYAAKAKIHLSPERLQEDIKSLLILPAVREVWKHLRQYHDSEFVDFVDRLRKK